MSYEWGMVGRVGFCGAWGEKKLMKILDEWPHILIDEPHFIEYQESWTLDEYLAVVGFWQKVQIFLTAVSVVFSGICTLYRFGVLGSVGELFEILNGNVGVMAAVLAMLIEILQSERDFFGDLGGRRERGTGMWG